MRIDESQPDLDTLIDGVAREMTAGEPGTALRSGVAERIRAARHPWQGPVWPWAAAAAVLVLAATVLWSRPDRTSTPVPPPEALATRGAPAVAVADRDPAGQEARGVDERVLVLRAAPVPGSRPAPAATGPAPIETPTLTVDSLLVESLEPERVVLEAIAGPRPIDVERLEVEPLPTYRVE